MPSLNNHPTPLPAPPFCTSLYQGMGVTMGFSSNFHIKGLDCRWEAQA